jgi:hypothetical protein
MIVQIVLVGVVLQMERMCKVVYIVGEVLYCGAIFSLG